jgi:hypothetical protein
MMRELQLFYVDFNLFFLSRRWVFKPAFDSIAAHA